MIVFLLEEPSMEELLNGILPQILKSEEFFTIHHDGKGCSISLSSASVMSDVLVGHKVEDANKLILEFYGLVIGKEPENEEELGEAIAYMGVKNFPARIKCATLAWKAIEKAIDEVIKSEK